MCQYLDEHSLPQVFTGLGLNETDLEGFFVGPAFFAWYEQVVIDSVNVTLGQH